MTSAEVERLLIAAARFQAARLGYGFGDDSWSLTENLIRQGVTRLQTDGALASAPRLAQAEAGVALLVARMVEEAGKAGVTELREFTFDAAQRAICPLWPFC